MLRISKSKSSQQMTVDLRSSLAIKMVAVMTCALSVAVFAFGLIRAMELLQGESRFVVFDHIDYVFSIVGPALFCFGVNLYRVRFCLTQNGVVSRGIRGKTTVRGYKQIAGYVFYHTPKNGGADARQFLIFDDSGRLIANVGPNWFAGFASVEPWLSTLVELSIKDLTELKSARGSLQKNVD